MNADSMKVREPAARVPAALARLALCGALLLASAHQARAQEGRGLWHDVELPEGFYLDLSTGEVSSRRPPDEHGALTLIGRRVLATPALSVWSGLGAERASSRLTRGGGRRTPEVALARGAEWIFDARPETWGYLRVLDVEPALRLEYAHAARGETSLHRRPSAVSVECRGDALFLSWFPAGESGADYAVFRSVLGAPGTEEELVATLGESTWTDRDPPSGRLLEYRVARLDGAHADRPFGARARGCLEVHPADWPQFLESGAQINLLSGDASSGRAHVEVVHAGPDMVHLRPLTETRLVPLSPSEGARWELPDPDEVEYTTALRALKVGGQMAALLSEGVFVRLRVVADGEGRVSLLRQFELDGGRLLPNSPAEPSVRWTPEGVLLEFEFPRGADDPEIVSLVVERELGFLRGDWEEVLVTAPGVRSCVLPVESGEEDPRLVRYRFRHRYPWDAQSPPGPPIRVIHGDPADEAVIEALLDQAFADLVHPDYERRVAARGMLESMGERAWPRLREALDSDEPELADAARDLLLSSADVVDHLAVVLRARARRESVEGPAPPGWFDPEADLRALAILRAVGDDGGEAIEGWLRVSAQADPDDRVRRLAGLTLERVPDLLDPPRAGEPLALVPPQRRRPPSRTGWRTFFARGPSVEEARRAARASADASRPGAALVGLRIAHFLETEPRGSGEGGWRAEDEKQGPDPDTIELALRNLVEFEVTGDELLMAAAASLVPDPGSWLFAFRELSNARLARHGTARPLPDGRTRRVLATADAGALALLLDTLSDEGASYVDVVLPAGVYEWDDPGEREWLQATIDGLRLVADGPVELRAGVRAEGISDLVLEGLSISNERGPALLLVDATVTVLGGELAGMDSTIMVQSSLLELDRVECRGLSTGRRSNWIARMTGPSWFLARDTLLQAGSFAPGEEGTIYLDRCVVDAEDRNLVQGQRAGVFVARDCLLHGRASGVLHVDQGLLEGVLLDVANQPVGQSGRVRLCPEHVWLSGAADVLQEDQLFLCPLRGRR